MDFLKNLTPIKIAAIVGAALAVVVLLGFLVIKLVTPPMSILYTNLAPDDSGLITSRLDAMGISYRVSDGAREIQVPVNKVLMLRMTFAAEGVPRSGSVVGYEIFDKAEALGTSQFVHNVNLVRALEGELSRTVSSLMQIDTARVHLVMPKKELFSKVASEPSASVILKMKGGQALGKQEVAAISHLVATAVPGLKVDNITIVDNSGRPLKLSSNEDNQAAAITDGISEYQHSVENRLKSIIEELLERSVGIGKVKANVSAVIDFDREIINSEVYDPDGQVVRSRKVSEENDSEKEASSSEVGVAGNLPGAQGAGGGVAGKNKNRTDEVTNFEISKTITNKVSESGRIKRLSIAILVDGTYQVVKAEEGKSEKEEQIKYNPRTQEELDKIKTLAISAVGIDAARGDKIEVINMQFSEEFATIPEKKDPMSWLRDELENIVQMVIIGVVIILVILLVVRPVVMRSLELKRIALEQSENIEASISSEQLATAGADGMIVGSSIIGGASNFQPDEMIDLTSTEDKRKVSLIKQVNELVEKHPEETVSVIRNWLYSGE